MLTIVTCAVRLGSLLLSVLRMWRCFVVVIAAAAAAAAAAACVGGDGVVAVAAAVARRPLLLSPAHSFSQVVQSLNHACATRLTLASPYTRRIRSEVDNNATYFRALIIVFEAAAKMLPLLAAVVKLVRHCFS
jgi:hypothetical protein